MDDSKLHIVAVTGFLRKEEKFLILKRSEREIAFPGKWTTPGGKVEKSDSVRETLRKEFKEETGLDIGDDMKFFCDDEFTRPDGYHVIVLKFLCQYRSGEVVIDTNDFTDYAWVGLEELAGYDLIDGVRKDFELLKSSVISFE